MESFEVNMQNINMRNSIFTDNDICEIKYIKFKWFGYKRIIIIFIKWCIKWCPSECEQYTNNKVKQPSIHFTASKDI